MMMKLFCRILVSNLGQSKRSNALAQLWHSYYEYVNNNVKNFLLRQFEKKSKQTRERK